MQTQPLTPPAAPVVAVEVGPPPLRAPEREPPAEPRRAPSPPVTPGYTRHSLGVIEADRDRRLQERGLRGRRPHRTGNPRPHPRLGAALEAARTRA
jgi:hypothetical protein